ncbi:hypothetical protein [Herbidospora yilanensis]|uniref:hypothetical protein n=1 Tax=Herbidospora yilanensis TaxID=354426 RepID=UPI000780B331|nr:hypothetical protein [Herbidospora yilanensis]
MRDFDAPSPLATLFDRPPATEADLADARARFVAAAAKARPRDRNLLKPLLAALMTALLAVTAAIGLRPLPAGDPPPERPEPSAAQQILLKAADLAPRYDDVRTRKPGEYLYVGKVYRGWDARKGKITTSGGEFWTPGDGTGPWLHSTGRRETLFSRVCPSDDPLAWSSDLRAEITAGGRSGASDRFRRIAAMLDWTTFHPERTAALLRMAAEVPGLTVTRGQVDAMDRPAFTVGLDRDGFRDELVFNEPEGVPVGRRTVVTREIVAPEGTTPAGTVIGHAVALYGVTPALPRRPAGSLSIGNERLTADQVKRVEREARCD